MIRNFFYVVDIKNFVTIILTIDINKKIDKKKIHRPDTDNIHCATV